MLVCLLFLHYQMCHDVMNTSDSHFVVRIRCENQKPKTNGMIRIIRSRHCLVIDNNRDLIK